MNRIIPLAFAILLSAPLIHAENHDTREWFKGNTHTHTLWSDGNDFPEMIIDWYKSNGYDFIALSDHNVLQEGEKWVSLPFIKKRQRAIGRGAVMKCEARFGKDWLQWETRGEEKGIILKTLEQCTEELAEPGEFYLLPAEEISNSGSKKPVHINAINLKEVIPAIKDDEASAQEVMRRSMKAVKARAKETGRPILAHLNHPNFQWALTAEDLAAVAEGDYFEIYNGHPGINHLGDEERPGDEEIWDIANTIRISEMKAAPLMGVATDDSHTYHGGDVSPGRGWIMVGADKLNGDEIVIAMQKGDFYASSGVTIDRMNFDEKINQLTLEITPAEGITFTTQFIGTREGYDAAAEETGIGEVFATVKGNSPTFNMPEDALYLRATVTSSSKHPSPSFEGQKQQAWIQPVGWKAE
ncbi:hypothetical protein N9Z18_01390 [Verrucomicrobiales bacterium]|nr:hypothetical protein [Verrucomicrobiales bacterium]MDB4358874.1 hypothetical protein [Verrucomicrobiales bacterium]